jgi:hypothetical protein
MRARVVPAGLPGGVVRDRRPGRVEACARAQIGKASWSHTWHGVIMTQRAAAGLACPANGPGTSASACPVAFSSSGGGPRGPQGGGKGSRGTPLGLAARARTGFIFFCLASAREMTIEVSMRHSGESSWLVMSWGRAKALAWKDASLPVRSCGNTAIKGGT